MSRDEGTPAIEVRQGAGGKSAFAGRSGVRVSDIAQRYEWTGDDLIAERIQRSLPSISVEQVHAALDYWRAHKKEIEAEIEGDLAALERVPPAY